MKVKDTIKTFYCPCVKLCPSNFSEIFGTEDVNIATTNTIANRHKKKLSMVLYNNHKDRHNYPCKGVFITCIASFFLLSQSQCDLT